MIFTLFTFIVGKVYGEPCFYSLVEKPTSMCYILTKRSNYSVIKPSSFSCRLQYNLFNVLNMTNIPLLHLNNVLGICVPIIPLGEIDHRT